MWASMLAVIVPISRLVAACCRNASPIKRKEKPNKNSPILFLLDLLENIIGIPIASRGIANAAMSTLKPMADITHAVTVVPMLAPIMTPIACARVISPAFTKLTTITVVADDDCIIAVITIPVMTPIKRLLVIAARMARNLLPANFSSPSLIIFIPYRNKASEPNSEKMLMIVSIFYLLIVFLFACCQSILHQ